MGPKTLVLVLLAVLSLALAACEEGNTVVNTSGAGNGISVSGAGVAFGTPDIAVLNLGVQAQARNVADARDTAATTAQAIIDSLKKNGVADKDIQTTQFNISPQYDYRPNGSPTIVGYQVTNVLSVKIRKIDTTSKVLDDATAAGGNNTVVQNITFTIEDFSKLREEARSDAMTEARAKAEQLAREAGVKLGSPISVSESTGAVPQPGFVTAPRTGPGVTPQTPIQTGELQVNITVTVVYAIE